jgi:polyphosphate kinase
MSRSPSRDTIGTMTIPATTAPATTPSRSRVSTPRRGTPANTVLVADGVRRASDRFLDRELSWLAFNERVLELARDPQLPLLERVRFLAIFANNLDEFFMVRVAGLKRRIATGLAVTAASGLEPREVLQAISTRAHELQALHAAAYRDEVEPALGEAGIKVVHWGLLPEAEQERLHAFFRDQVFPVLTPLAVDPAHPFPYISGLSLNLAVILRNP